MEQAKIWRLMVAVAATLWGKRCWCGRSSREQRGVISLIDQFSLRSSLSRLDNPKAALVHPLMEA